MMSHRLPWSRWSVNVLTLVLSAIWAVPILWATIVSFRPPDDSLGRGDVWFGDALSADSYQKATDLAPFFPPNGEIYQFVGFVAALVVIQILIVFGLRALSRRSILSDPLRTLVLVLDVVVVVLLVMDAVGKLSHSYYVNTLEFVLLSLVVQLITVTLAGFAFARFDFVGKKLIFYFILMQMMIPTAVLIVPNFVTIREFSTETLLIPHWLYYHKFNLYDTPMAMALPYFGSAFGTFLMRQAFLSVPEELVDAGVVDGCRWYHLLWNVYLPPSWPSLIAFGLVSVSFHWNELLWPLVVTSDKARPLTMGLLRFTQLTDIGAQWALIMAATLIIVAPLLIAFLVFQRQFIRSFLYSGLK
jgi:sn-glycerol 3-phosphate transport system permease protein